jgi:hypothetical protein
VIFKLARWEGGTDLAFLDFDLEIQPSWSKRNMSGPCKTEGPACLPLTSLTRKEVDQPENVL